MPMQLMPDDQSLYPRVVAGSISALSLQLHDELSSIGYSLLPEDVTKAFINEVQYFVGWAVLSCQRGSTVAVFLDESIVLDAGEWAIIEPVVRAHTDVLQAQLVEGSRSLGGDGFGMSVSEAKQNHTIEREKLQKLAFVEAPFSFKTLGGL